MNAVVAVPPIEDFYFTRHRLSHLGAGIVADILLSCGLSVQLLDFPNSKKKTSTIPLPDELAYLSRHILPAERGKLSYFTRYQRLGPDLGTCADTVVSYSPSLCCISSFAFCYAQQAIGLAEEIKKRDPSVKIIAGGGAVSAYPEYFIRNSAIDYAYSGEAEAGIRECIARIKTGSNNFDSVPNCYWKTGDDIHEPGTIRHTVSNDLSCHVTTLPVSGRRCLTTALSRGCTQKCRFCSVKISHGSTFRTVPIERVEETLDTILIDQNGGKKPISVNIEDDNLLLDPGYCFGVLDTVQRRWPSVSVYMENGIDYNLLTPEVCDRLIGYGMTRFNLSLVSTDPATARHQNRPLSLDRYIRTVEHIRHRRCSTVTYFICGLPGDTIETAARTLAFLYSQPTLAGISLFYPVPGIPPLTHPDTFKTLSPRLCAGSSAQSWNGSLSVKTMITAFRLSRYVNLRKECNQLKKESQLIAITENTKKLHTIVADRSGERIIPVPSQDIELVRRFFSLVENTHCVAAGSSPIAS
jgi:hypothetical protein